MTIAPRPAATLRLAVTGHRDLKGQDGAIEAALRATFEAAGRALASAIAARPAVHSSAAGDEPLLAVATALAEGADQLAVTAFRRAVPPPGMTTRVEAVIPFAAADYATTMSAGAARAMADLLASADRRMVLADRALGPDPDEPEEKRFRDQRYATVGDMLVRQADIVVAVWNGIANNAIGGTAYVASMALRDGVPVLWIDARNARIRLLEPGDKQGDVLVRARDRVLEREKAGAVDWEAALGRAVEAILGPPPGPEKTPSDAELGWFHGILGGWWHRHAKSRLIGVYRLLVWVSGSHVDVKNAREAFAHAHHGRQWRERFPRLWVKCDHVADRLEPAKRHDAPLAPPSGLPDLRRILGDTWAAADDRATRLGNGYRSGYAGIFLLGALAVLLGLVGVIDKEHKVWWVVAELLALGLGGFLFWRQRHNRVHDRFLATRGIGEELHAEWAWAGIGRCGRSALTAEADWAAWSVQAVVARVGLPTTVLDRDHLAATARYLAGSMAAEQFDYHVRNHVRLTLFHHALEKTGMALVLVGGAVALAFVLLYPVLPAAWTAALAGWVTFFGAGFPAVAAALAGIRYHGDFERFATRSKQTARALLAIENRLLAFAGKPGAYEELRDIVVDLREALLNDLDDWRFVYRARPVPEP